MQAILLVDDDAFIREELAALLADEGYTVLQAGNGQEALVLLRDAGDPCVILLDLMMPVMNGWAFRSAQAADPRLARIPVVILTCMVDGEREAKMLGAAECLTKPFEFEPLLAVIRRHCHPGQVSYAP